MRRYSLIHFNHSLHLFGFHVLLFNNQEIAIGMSLNDTKGTPKCNEQDHNSSINAANNDSE